MSFVPERLTRDFALAMVRRNSNGISYTVFLITLFSGITLIGAVNITVMRFKNS